MANIEDYLQWRGDLTFQERPFNEIDNLILAVMSYSDIDDILTEEDEMVPLPELRDRYFERHTREEVSARKTLIFPIWSGPPDSVRRFGTWATFWMWIFRSGPVATAREAISLSMRPPSADRRSRAGLPTSTIMTVPGSQDLFSLKKDIRESGTGSTPSFRRTVSSGSSCTVM